LGDESIPKKKQPEVDKGKVTLRRIAGIMALIVGIPNFLAGIAMSFGGIAATIALGVMAYQLYTGDSGDDPLKALCVVFLLILVVIGLILAIIFTIIAIIFAIGVAGQTIGGYYGLRGRRYNRALILTLLGSLVSLLAGIGMLVAGLSMKDAEQWVKMLALIWGGYDLFAFFVTTTSFILFIVTKSTFIEPEKKPKKKKKEKKSSTSKRKNRKKEEDEDEDWDN